MTNSEIRALVERLVADASDARIDDAMFRRRAKRAAAGISRALAAHVANGRKGGQPSRYAFIAVPNGSGGVASVSMPRATYDALAAALGGAQQVNALARKAASSHRPASGLSRSGHVRKRLQQLAARKAASDA